MDVSYFVLCMLRCPAILFSSETRKPNHMSELLFFFGTLPGPQRAPVVQVELFDGPLTVWDGFAKCRAPKRISCIHLNLPAFMDVKSIVLTERIRGEQKRRRKINKTLLAATSGLLFEWMQCHIRVIVGCCLSSQKFQKLAGFCSAEIRIWWIFPLYYHEYFVCECWTVGWTLEDVTLECDGSFAIRQFTCYEILNMIINLKRQWTFCLVSKENHRHAIMKHHFGCL